MFICVHLWLILLEAREVLAQGAQVAVTDLPVERGHARVGLMRQRVADVFHQPFDRVGRVPADATAFALRDREFIVNIVARTPTAEGFADVVDWARGVTSALGPDAGTYVNFTGEADTALVRASYPAETYRRLVELTNEYDPTNLFRLNQNIAPSV